MNSTTENEVNRGSSIEQYISLPMLEDTFEDFERDLKKTLEEGKSNGLNLTQLKQIAKIQCAKFAKENNIKKIAAGSIVSIFLPYINGLTEEKPYDSQNFTLFMKELHDLFLYLERKEENGQRHKKTMMGLPELVGKEMLRPNIRQIWDKLSKHLSIDEDDESVINVLWNLLDQLIRGYIEIQTTEQNRKILYYTKKSNDADLDRRLIDLRSGGKRRELYTALNTRVDGFLSQQPAMQDNSEHMTETYRSLRESTRKLILMDKDVVSEYFAAVRVRLEQLETPYKKAGNYLKASSFRKCLDSYLGPLEDYCTEARKSGDDFPIVRDLLSLHHIKVSKLGEEPSIELLLSGLPNVKEVEDASIHVNEVALAPKPAPAPIPVIDQRAIRISDPTPDEIPPKVKKRSGIDKTMIGGTAITSQVAQQEPDIQKQQPRVTSGTSIVIKSMNFVDLINGLKNTAGNSTLTESVQPQQDAPEVNPTTEVEILSKEMNPPVVLTPIPREEAKTSEAEVVPAVIVPAETVPAEVVPIVIVPAEVVPAEISGNVGDVLHVLGDHRRDPSLQIITGKIARPQRARILDISEKDAKDAIDHKLAGIDAKFNAATRGNLLLMIKEEDIVGEILDEIIHPLASNHKLKTYILSKLCEIVNQYDSESELGIYLAELLAELFDRLRNQSLLDASFSEKLKKTLNVDALLGQNEDHPNTTIPESYGQNLETVVNAELKEYFTNNDGRRFMYSEINSSITKLLELISTFEITREVIDLLSSKDFEKEFMAYCEKSYKIVKDVKMKANQLRGSGLTNFFRLIGGNEERKISLEKYHEFVTNYVDRLWTLRIVPNLVSLAKITLGEYRY